jgi:hypothetical protein
VFAKVEEADDDCADQTAVEGEAALPDLQKIQRCTE